MLIVPVETANNNYMASVNNSIAVSWKISLKLRKQS